MCSTMKQFKVNEENNNIKNNLDWRLTIKVNILTLKFAGLWPKESDMFYALYTVFSIVFIVGGAIAFQILYVVFVHTNLENLTGPIFITATQTLGSFKMCYFVKNRKILERLMKTLKSDLFKIKTSSQNDKIQPSLLVWKVIYYAFWILVFSTTVLWSILPLLDHSFKEKQLPFAAWYPYNVEISPIYEFSYIHQVVGIFFVAIASLNIDTFMAALMMFTGAQCEILSDDLRTLQNLISSDFHRKLINCIIHHQEILSFAENVNRFFNMIALGQFFTSSVTIAMAMFQLSLVDPLSNEAYSLLFYESAVTVQLFLYCWFGNEVEIKYFTTFSLATFLTTVTSKL